MNLEKTALHRAAPRGAAPFLWALAAASAMLAIGACEGSVDAPVVSQEMADIDADLVLYEMTEYLTRDGVRSGEVKADSAYMYRDSSVARLYEVDMTLFTDIGVRRATVIADSGRLHQRTEEMVAWGNVLLTVLEGDILIETSELHYDPGADRIYSDAPTTYREAGRTTRGSCFRSDLDFRNYEVCSIRGSADIGTANPADTADAGRQRP